MTLLSNHIPRNVSVIVILAQSAIILLLLIDSLNCSQYKIIDTNVLDSALHNLVERNDDTFAQTAPPQSQPTLLTESTALIITSSWIPAHPSTEMIETVINSTRRLKGASPTAPIIITIDDFTVDFFDRMKNISEIDVKRNDLEEYSMNLVKKYAKSPNVHILPGMDHLHIGGSVIKAMELIELLHPTVKYVYYIQHDFEFSEWIDHMGLIEVMEKYPNTVNMIRFLKRFEINPKCGNATKIFCTVRTFDENGNVNKDDDSGETSAVSRNLTLFPAEKYSDNNHLARFHWYKETIQSLISVRRPPEFPLANRAYQVCQNNESMGIYLYYSKSLRHLDGRHTVKA